MGAWQKPTLMEPNQTGSTRKVRRWLEEHDVDYMVLVQSLLRESASCIMN